MFVCVHEARKLRQKKRTKEDCKSFTHSACLFVCLLFGEYREHYLEYVWESYCGGAVLLPRLPVLFINDFSLLFSTPFAILQLQSFFLLFGFFLPFFSNIIIMYVHLFVDCENVVYEIKYSVK